MSETINMAAIDRAVDALWAEHKPAPVDPLQWLWEEVASAAPGASVALPADLVRLAIEELMRLRSKP
jgi:hypothetical protein